MKITKFGILRDICETGSAGFLHVVALLDFETEEEWEEEKE